MSKKDRGETIVKWETREHPFRKKPGGWYSSVMIIGTALAVASIILGDIIFAILIIIAMFALLLASSVPPKEIEASVTEKGVVIGSYFYQYENLKSFWINKIDDPPRLLLKSEKKLSPLIGVEIMNINEEEVRGHLKEKLKEEEMYEPVLQKIMEYIGF
ncbi:MAG: hypothetical protein ACQEP6_02005 [Patescibacteria group bacterium]